MLVLARKIGEKIIVNDNIEIIVLDANQNTVRIGINAPQNVSVYREELYKEIKSANKDSIDASESTMNELHNLVKAKSFSNTNYELFTNKINH